MGCTPYWQQLRELEKALGTMKRFGIPLDNPALQALSKVHMSVISQVIPKFPRSLTQLIRFIGLSPGVLALWHDNESGWMVEARTRPGTPPFYHAVGDQAAMDILQGRDLHYYMDLYSHPPVGVDN